VGAQFLHLCFPRGAVSTAAPCQLRHFSATSAEWKTGVCRRTFCTAGCTKRHDKWTQASVMWQCLAPPVRLGDGFGPGGKTWCSSGFQNFNEYLNQLWQRPAYCRRGNGHGHTGLLKKSMQTLANVST